MSLENFKYNLSLPGIILLVLCTACSSNKHELVQTGEADFRITLNYNRVLTDAEQDSIENTNPFYLGLSDSNKFYDLLVQKGFVSNQELDTTGFNFSSFTEEDTVISFREVTFELHTSEEKDYLIARKNDRIIKADLGHGMLGERFLSYSDIDNDGTKDVLIMEKYYVMGGYNFELKLFNFK